MESKNINLIIADDHMLFRDGLRLLLQDEPDIVIIGAALDGKELLNLLQYEIPDLILLDINMPKIDGLECCKQIKEKHPQIKIIMLSTYNENHLIEKAKKHGAKGYSLKNCDKTELSNLLD